MAKFNKRCYGVVIIKSENSKWNADFSGTPRMLPDDNGTIYATDKALKFAMRKYWSDIGQNVFVWKTFKKDKDGNSLINTRENRYNDLKKKLDTNNTIELLSKCIDTKLFGITLTLKKEKKDKKDDGEKDNKDKEKDSDNSDASALSLTGPAQISYGIDRFNLNRVYSNSITSPFPSSEKEKQGSIGNEVKNLKSYYVYDFVINPKNSTDHYDEIAKPMELDDGDISLFKEAINRAATNLNTGSKMGSENLLTLFVTLKEGSKTQIRALKNLIIIDNSESVDFKDVKDLLSKYPDIESIELFKSDPNCNPLNIGSNWSVKDVI